MANEAAVEQRLKKLLDSKDKCVGLRIVGGHGFPDRIACVNGRFLGIEVKDDINGSYRLKKSQKLRLQHIVNAGGIACAVDKFNIQWFDEFLDAIIENPSIKLQKWGYIDDE